uniref:Uncharacterized protein n=1 Tax=Rhizophora mucronata TaxID=61149 RepID=A0A2P2QGP9_RHIMU
MTLSSLLGICYHLIREFLGIQYHISFHRRKPNHSIRAQAIPPSNKRLSRDRVARSESRFHPNNHSYLRIGG